jgi:hypothetical protein
LQGSLRHQGGQSVLSLQGCAVPHVDGLRDVLARLLVLRRVRKDPRHVLVVFPVVVFRGDVAAPGKPMLPADKPMHDRVACVAGMRMGRFHPVCMEPVFRGPVASAPNYHLQQGPCSAAHAGSRGSRGSRGSCHGVKITLTILSSPTSARAGT